LSNYKRKEALMSKFALQEHCFLITGVKRAAIYDLQSGDVYSIDERARSIVEQFESGVLISDIRVQGVSPEAVVKYLTSLETAGLGRFIGDSEAISKIELPKPHDLEFLWLEVTPGCNLFCMHCYAGSSPAIINLGKMTYADWVRVMREAYEFGCRRIQFIGGEPFLLHDQLIDLIVCAKAIGYEFVEVFTNCTLITDAWMDRLAENNVAIATSFYGPTAEVHERVTRVRGSFQKTLGAIKSLVARGIKVRIAMIVMKANQDYVAETIEFLRRETGVSDVSTDLVRPSGRGCNSEIVAEDLLRQRMRHKPDFPKCGPEDFQRRRYGHNCFSKEVCVTASGDVFPCVMERDRSYGNVLERSVPKILLSLRACQTRLLTKDQVEVCRDCEFRYACFDCRPKAHCGDSDGNFLAKPSDCSYNPYEGQWS